MPAYSFSLDHFQTAIPEGDKVRTTRMMATGRGYRSAMKAWLKHIPVRLYWKQRTKQCRLLLEAPIKEVRKIRIYPTDFDMALDVDGVAQSFAERNAYGCEEGFVGNDALTPWEQFIEALEELHGPDYWREELYTVRWVREPEKVK